MVLEVDMQPLTSGTAGFTDGNGISSVPIPCRRTPDATMVSRTNA